MKKIIYFRIEEDLITLFDKIVKQKNEIDPNRSNTIRNLIIEEIVNQAETLSAEEIIKLGQFAPIKSILSRKKDKKYLTNVGTSV